jgi:hypothetical protein
MNLKLLDGQLNLSRAAGLALSSVLGDFPLSTKPYEYKCLHEPCSKIRWPRGLVVVSNFLRESERD